VDFENYSVDKERANSIRERLERIRQSETVLALALLVDEFGREETEAPEDGTLPGLLKDSDKTRVFETGRELLGATRLLRIERARHDLRLFADGRRLLDVSFLPKNSEFLVNMLAPEEENELLETCLSALSEDAGRAKGKKSERQNAFRARFQKAEKTAAPALEAPADVAAAAVATENHETEVSAAPTEETEVVETAPTATGNEEASIAPHEETPAAAPTLDAAPGEDQAP